MSEEKPESPESEARPGKPIHAGEPPAERRAGRVRRKRKKWKLVMVGVGLLLFGALSVPFVFTGSLVRYLVAQSAYKDLPLEFRSASLSPWGALTVRGVTIDDQRESKGKRLASADAVRVSFAWGKIMSGRVKTIQVVNLDATLRPGDDTALTLLRLFSPTDESGPAVPPKSVGTQTAIPSPITAPTTAAASAHPASANATAAPTPAPAIPPAAAPSGNPFWFDELAITGKVHIEGYEPWQQFAQLHPADTLPARLVVTTSGPAAAPARDFTLTLGKPDAPTEQSIVSHFRLSTVGTDSIWVLDSLTVSNLLGKSTLTADARYNTTADRLESASIRLRGLDGADVTNALPTGLTAAGRVEGDLQYIATAAGGNLSANINPSAPLTMNVPEGALTVSGAPAVALRATYDAAGHAIQINTATLHGINSLQADAGFVKYFETDPLISPGSAAASALKNLDSGAFAALADLSITGRINLAGPAPVFTGTLNIKGVSAGKSADAPIAENISLSATLDVPLAAALDFNALRITAGRLTADKLTAGKNIITQLSADLAADQGKMQITQSSFLFADGKAAADAQITLPARLEALHVTFTHMDQQILTAALYPTVFTAEGHVTAKLTLERKKGEPLTGTIDLTSEEAGRLKISRDASTASFGQAAKAIAAQPNSMLPPNFDDIVVGQLANYPYDSGHLLVLDDVTGLLLKFDYRRPPPKDGEPGFSVSVPVAGQQLKSNVAFQLSPSLSLKNYSVMTLLHQFLGLRDSVLNTTTAPASRPATAPASRPTPSPATAPATRSAK